MPPTLLETFKTALEDPAVELLRQDGLCAESNTIYWPAKQFIYIYIFAIQVDRRIGGEAGRIYLYDSHPGAEIDVCI